MSLLGCALGIWRHHCESQEAGLVRHLFDVAASNAQADLDEEGHRSPDDELPAVAYQVEPAEWDGPGNTDLFASTLQEIADELGVSVPRVRQIEASALRKFAHHFSRPWLTSHLPAPRDNKWRRTI